MMKPRIIFLMMALILTLTYPVSAADAAGKNGKKLKTIQILGINDFHGQLENPGLYKGEAVGGAAYLAAYLKKYQKKYPSTLLLHSGDAIGASPPLSSLFQDEPAIDFLNRMGFDAGTVGNHEFDDGEAELLRVLNGNAPTATESFSGASFPYVAANIKNKETGQLVFPPYTIIKTAGVPVGVIGVITDHTPVYIHQYGTENLEFTDEVKAVNKYVKELNDKGVHTIIVLAHVGGRSNPNGTGSSGEAVKLARRVNDDVDVIMAGHSHQFLNSKVDGKLLVQAYSKGMALSQIILKVDPETEDVDSSVANIIMTRHQGIKPDLETQLWIKEQERVISHGINKMIGLSAFPITKEMNVSKESALGNLVADAYRTTSGSDIALVNPGSLRKNIDQGLITWANLYSVLPFNDSLVTLSMTGKEIEQVLEQQWGKKRWRMLQISGFRYTYTRQAAPGRHIKKIYMDNGKRLEADKTYTVTVNSFLAGGGDGFTKFRDMARIGYGTTDLNALIQYIAREPQPFIHEIDGRIQRLD